MQSLVKRSQTSGGSPATSGMIRGDTWKSASQSNRVDSSLADRQRERFGNDPRAGVMMVPKHHHRRRGHRAFSISRCFFIMLLLRVSVLCSVRPPMSFAFVVDMDSSSSSVQRSMDVKSSEDVHTTPIMISSHPLATDGPTKRRSSVGSICPSGRISKNTISNDNDTLEDEFSNTFPMDLVMGHEAVKQALMIVAVLSSSSSHASSSSSSHNNNNVASLIVSGGTGTCKSVLARSLPRLLHCSPVYVPSTVNEAGLTGTVDLEASLVTGRSVFSPGVLYQCSHPSKKILVADDINLMEDGAAATLCNALTDGLVRVEREGLSVSYPSCPAVTVATWNPNYQEWRDHFLDRFALHASTDTHWTVSDRVQTVLNVEAFVDRSLGTKTNHAEASQQHFRLAQALEMEQHRISQIIRARELLPQVQIQHDQLSWLCQQATAWDCPGQRAELHAVPVAKAAAALEGRTAVQAGDLVWAMRFCIVPRGRVVPVSSESVEGQPTTPEAIPPGEAVMPPQSPSDIQPLPPPERMEEEAREEDESRTAVEEEPPQSDEFDNEEEEQEPLFLPDEFHFGVDTSIQLDPRLLQFHRLQRQRRGKRGGKRHSRFNLKRGRFVRAIFPPAGSQRGRLAVGATLRAATPYQLSRRKRKQQQMEQVAMAFDTTNEPGNLRRLRLQQLKPHRLLKVYVTKDDFRVQQLKKKTGSLIIFIVDASGSMALNRMSAAKG